MALDCHTEAVSLAHEAASLLSFVDVENNMSASE